MLRYFRGLLKNNQEAMPRRSLKRYLAWQIAGVVAASLLLVTSIVIGLMVQHIDNMRQETMGEISFHELRRVEQRIAYLVETVDRLAKNPLVPNGLVDAQGRQTYLPKLIENFGANRDVVGVSLVDFDGTPVFAVDEPLPSFNEFPELRQALAMNRRRVLMSPSMRHMIIVDPIEYYDTTQGAIIVSYDIRLLAQRIFQEEDQTLERLVGNNRMREPSVLYTQMTDNDEKYVITSAYPNETTPYLRNLNIRLDAGILKDDYYAPLRRIIFNFILLSVLAISAAILLAVRIGNGIARPILDLCEKITHMRPDDRTVFCDSLDTHDELEDLAGAFDRRTAELWAIRDNLERLVGERTHELQLANDSLKFLNFALDEHAIVSAADVQGHITYANDHFCSISGYTREELIGKNHRIVKSQEHSEEFYRAMWRRIAHGEVWHGEIKNSKRDGGYYWTSATIVPFLDEKGKPFKYISIRTDITERKKMEEELAAALDVANAATRAKSEFLANMSHEIRTPMNAIIGLTGLCLNTELSAKQRDYLHKVFASAESLLGILNDILDFSKIEAGQLDIENIPFDLDQVFDNLSTLISNKAYEKSLELLFFRPPHIPLQLVGDPLRLGQVLTNLTNNAIKFTSTGEVIVSVGMIGRSDNLVWLEFSVCDTGIGMTAKQQQRLFKSFSQTDSSITRKYGGTGLGLAISKQLVQMMGGNIHVKSTPDVGSSFIFSVPFGVVEPSDHEPREMNRALRDLCVMVVDDNVTSAEILSSYLESYAFQVTVCPSAREAFDILRESGNTFKLILIDWKMPDINGVEAAVLIKMDLLPETPPKIILITASSREDFVRVPGAEFLDGILNKPINPSLLFNTITELFSGILPLPMSTHKNGEPNMALLHSIQGARILLVEDNEINQEIASELLREANFVVDIANNGQEAIEMLVPGRYDCVLMDVQMPVLDGLEATRKIREDVRFAKLPILAMTANAMIEDRKITRDVGMNCHIAKPIDPQELFRALVEWIAPGERALPDLGGISEVEDHSSEDLPELPGINTRDGLNRMMGNVQAYRRLLIKFADNQIDTVRGIRYATASGDLKQAAHLAHTLKGVAGNIGANSLYQAARNFEVALLAEQTESLSALLVTAGDELNQVVSAIRTNLSSASLVAFGPVDSLNVEELVPRLRELRNLLTQYDSEAEDHLVMLMMDVSDPVILHSLQILEEKIAQYDFDSALMSLDVLNGQLTHSFLREA
ncbi:two-component system, sensor histidine kinase and response regulator [Gammaproteobacteria bacterium]